MYRVGKTSTKNHNEYALFIVQYGIFYILKYIAFFQYTCLDQYLEVEFA
jgi:hypothetical protein